MASIGQAGKKYGLVIPAKKKGAAGRRGRRKPGGGGASALAAFGGAGAGAGAAGGTAFASDVGAIVMIWTASAAAATWRPVAGPEFKMYFSINASIVF